LWNLEKGSSTADFEKWMKGALWMRHLCLQRLRGRGLRGSSFTGGGGSGSYVKKVCVGALLSEGNMYGRGARIPGTLLDE
jgi:hypothetical protein